MTTNLRSLCGRLWAEQDGFIVSSELVLTGSLLAGGAVFGLTQIRDTMTQELGDFSQSIGNLDQSYSVGGIRGHSAWTAGSAFYDRADEADGAAAPVIAPGNRIGNPDGRPTVCADVFPSAPPAFVPGKHPPVHPPHFAPPHAKPQPQMTKPVVPQAPATPKKPSPKDDAAVLPKAVAPQPHPCGHPKVTAGCPHCLPAQGLYSGCTPQAVGCFPPNTNYSMTSLGLSGYGSPYSYGGPYGHGIHPQGYRQWGGSPGAMSSVIEFQPACVPGGAVHAMGGFTGGHAVGVVSPGVSVHAHAIGVPATAATGVPCVAAPGPCPAPSCIQSPACGTVPVWGPREGSLPQRKIVFTEAPQPGVASGPKPGLEGIELRFSEVGDDDLRPLKGFADVKVLHIHGSRVTDEGIGYLRGLKRLEVLHLVGTQITNEGLEQLAELDNLRALHIHGGRLTPAGLKVLRELGHLRVLEVRDAGVPQEMVERFLDEQPKRRSKD